MLSSLRRTQARTDSGPSGPGEDILATRDASAALRWAVSPPKDVNLPFMLSRNGERMKMQLLVMPETWGGAGGHARGVAYPLNDELSCAGWG